MNSEKFSAINMKLLQPSTIAFTCKDFSVSQENFDLYYNDDKSILITQPQPSGEKLADYYKSEAYISHTDSSKSFTDKIYQMVKRFMLKKKLRLLTKQNKREKSLLDIGAGTGDFLALAKENNWQINGVEPNQKARSLAKEKGVFLNNSLEDVKSKFAVITLWHVLEHLPNLEEQIENIKKLLQDDGSLIVAVPNFKSYDAEYYKEFWAAYDVPRHLWHFSPAGIKNLFSKFDLELVQTEALPFDSFYVSLLSEKYKNESNNFIKAFQIGLQSNLKAKKSGNYSSLIYILKNKPN